ARDRNDRARLFAALGAFDDLELGRASLALAAEDPAERFAIIPRALEGTETRELAYAFLKERWDDLVARLPPADALALLSAPTAFCDPGHRADAEVFFGPRAARIDGGPQALAAALETVDACIARTQVDARGLETFLRKQ